MSRIRFAADILRPLRPSSILDVGCRDAALAREFPDIEYFGVDLIAGPGVKYVGDITRMEFNRTFDAVVALDVLEHLDLLSETFDRLIAIADRYFLISLPNTYDLQSRFAFAVKARLGGKYLFTEEPPLDRHRWLMSRDEILAFAEAKAAKHRADVKTYDQTYGSSGSLGIQPILGRMLARSLPKSLTTRTIFTLFTKRS